MLWEKAGWRTRTIFRQGTATMGDDPRPSASHNRLTASVSAIPWAHLFMVTVDTPRSLRRGILRSSNPFATCSCEHSASWRSVPKRFVPAKRNPFPPARRYAREAATERRSSQNIQRGVPVPVQYQPTGGAHVGTRGEAFLHAIPAPTALLRGEPGRDGDDRHLSSRA